MPDRAIDRSVRACPGCEASSSRALGTSNGFDIVRCRRCGTVFTAELPTAATAHDYTDYYCDANLTVPEFVHRRLDEIVRGFEKYRARGTLLDVGCGAGSLLDAAKRAGWNAEGLEVSRSAIAHLERAGHRVRQAFLAEVGYPAAHFDVIVAAGVLEHVADVSSMLAEVRRVLRPGGLFYATTPNGAGGSARLMGAGWSVVAPPEHLHLFSVSGIRVLLERHAFDVESVLAEGTNPFEMVHFVRRGLSRRARRCEDEAADDGCFDRVGTAYALNDALMRSRRRRMLRGAINRVLTLATLGDELKVWASRS